VTLTSLAIAAILGILLNAILPGKDYDFENSRESDTDAQKDKTVISNKNVKRA